MHIPLHCFASNLIQLGSIFSLLYYGRSSDTILSWNIAKEKFFGKRNCFSNLHNQPLGGFLPSTHSLAPEACSGSFLETDVTMRIHFPVQLYFQSLIVEKSFLQNRLTHVFALKHSTVLPSSTDYSLLSMFIKPSSTVPCAEQHHAFWQVFFYGKSYCPRNLRTLVVQ